jgi:two-component system chemotaxis sensor kinase CheA
MQQLRQLFVLESQDTLQQMEDSLLQLEKNPTDKEAINTLFRTAHTIKGSAGVVGMEDVSAFTHTMENVLEKVRSGHMVVTDDFIQFLLSCRDHVGRMLDAPEGDPDLREISQGLALRLKGYLETAAVPAAAAGKAEASPAKPAPDKLRQIFETESQATLGQIAAALSALQNKADSSLDEVLRGLNSLKHSAGLAGFKEVASSSQSIEHFLEECQKRENFIPDPNFFKCMEDSLDYLRKQVAGAAPATLQQVGADLSQRLQAYLAAPPPMPVENSAQPEMEETNAPLAASPQPVRIIQDQAVEDDNWHISLRFREDALRNGVEPYASIRYLANTGQIVSLHTLFDAMPSAADMNPQSCYVGFEIEYRSETATKESLENMLEVIQPFCRIHILSPHSRLSRYIQLIQELPEDTMRLGEMLIESGTLTERELNEGLTMQFGKTIATAKAKVEQRKLGQILVDSGIVQAKVVDAALQKQQQSRDARSVAQKIISVDAEKLDQLINLVGELVIANASINLLMQEVNNDKLKEVTSIMARLVEEIRNSTLRMRMVHIGGTFNRFHRLVHDISRELGKNIELVISGAETELDKSMVEKINDPLMHLVRNAIDHGIEPETERAANGKSLIGTVKLNAYHDSGSIVIEVGDDGAGLNRKRILDAAVNKGLVKVDQELTETEIDQLIFEPSLTTAREVTQLSGRGVGLDVVKRNIGGLNGTVDVKSVEGEGTTIQIILPLTLAIIDGFLLSVGKASFVVPLDRVVECVELSADKQQARQTGYLNLRGRVLPLLRLHDLFGIEAKSGAARRENIVVVHYGNQEAGLVVDELLGEFQAVIKPLGKIFEKLSGVSGATILGNGEVALILDVPELVKKYVKQDSRKHKTKTHLAVEAMPA